jgi:hypothetical protein
MAYSADWTLSQTTAFQEQVQMSVFKAAVAIANEAVSSKPAYLKRHNLATQVLNNFTNTLMMQFVFAAIEGGGLTTGATDAQVDSAVASIWNGIAGVSAADLQ